MILFENNFDFTRLCVGSILTGDTVSPNNMVCYNYHKRKILIIAVMQFLYVYCIFK